MLTHLELENHLNNLSYILLLKDVRKVNIPIDKLYHPALSLSGKLVGTRVRLILDTVLGKDGYDAKKAHHRFRWYISSKFLNSLYHDADYEFYSYLCSHPSVKLLYKRYGFASFSGHDFVIFDKDYDNGIATLSYNKRFLFQIRQFKSFVDAVKELLPSLQQSWVSKQKEKRDNLQERYAAIAVRRRTVLDFRR